MDIEHADSITTPSSLRKSGQPNFRAREQARNVIITHTIATKARANTVPERIRVLVGFFGTGIMVCGAPQMRSVMRGLTPKISGPPTGRSAGSLC